MPRLLKIWIISSLLFLTACSSITFVYNRLDFIIPWYLGRYVDLERNQKRFLKQELKPFLAWHRQSELPFYLELLKESERSLDSTQTQASVRAQYDQLATVFDRLNAESVKWSIALGEQLSDEQIQEFIENLRENQAEYEEEYLSRSDEEYREENFEEMVDSLEDFLGKLTEEQRVMVLLASQRLKRWDRLWLEDRSRWLDDLADMLKREAGWQQRVLDMVAREDENFSSQYNEVLEHNINVICGLIADVGNTRTEKQDRRARRKLQGYIEDVQSLIDQGD